MLETVESSLGAPDPEDLAKQQRAVHTAKEPSENGAPDSNPGMRTFIKCHKLLIRWLITIDAQ